VPSQDSALADLAANLRGAEVPLIHRWEVANRSFLPWVGQPDLRATLRQTLRALAADQPEKVISRSRETTTHFAWCLRDRAEEQFSFWLHEYKPQSDWRPGYADSVHNHRYHFCTTIVSGGYTHERYRADVDDSTGLVSSVALVRSTSCEVGAAGALLADEFHRIPRACDATITFLVKSREVTSSSLSYDPGTGIAHRHVPVESRLDDLAERM
jgi:hypothetical protein